MTLPLILLRSSLCKEDLQKITAIFASKEQEHLESLEFLQALVKQHQTVQKTIEIASSYSKKALKTLREHFPLSKERKSLEDLITALPLRIK